MDMILIWLGAVVVAVTAETLKLHDKIDRLMREITDAQARELAAAWGAAWDDLRGDLVRAVADTLATTGRITVAMLRTNRRLTLVLQQVLDRLELVVAASEAATIASLRQLVDSAIWAQRSILDTQLPPGFDLTQVTRWSRVDQRQVDAMVLRAMDRIHSLNRPLAENAVTALKRELVRAVAVGSNPRVTARRIVQRAGDAGFGGGLTRAMTIARTETLDAYREGARIGQEPHADVLAGWTWRAALSPRTCPACLSMHGRDFPLSQAGPEGHQNCRCSRLPKLKSWSELGIEGVDEPPSLMPDADEYFHSLTPSQQRDSLGARGYQAWLAGEWDRDAWAVKRKSSGWRDSWVNAKPPAVGATGGGKPPKDPNRGFRTPPGDGNREYWDARQAALEGPNFASNGESLEPEEIVFAERMVQDLRQSLSWIPTGSNGTDELGTLPAADFVWQSLGNVVVEHKGLLPSTPVELKFVMRQIKKALHKNARRPGIVERVLIDLGDRPIPTGLVNDLTDKYRENPDLRQLWVMSRDVITEVPLA